MYPISPWDRFLQHPPLSSMAVLVYSVTMECTSFPSLHTQTLSHPPPMPIVENYSRTKHFWLFFTVTVSKNGFFHYTLSSPFSLSGILVLHNVQVAQLRPSHSHPEKRDLVASVSGYGTYVSHLTIFHIQLLWLQAGLQPLNPFAWHHGPVQEACSVIQ